MFETKKLDKYFNKRKSNEIHVIDQTSLTFPNTGLVCLLGASGSGKTTLLNVIGGLDKVDSGSIIFDEYEINRYSATKWDYIRNQYFGYIFQNYLLLPELTVYENLRFVLKMLHLEEEEINFRIEYALNAVGMIKYKKRRPSQLSGGQQQRIAIARALVKSPKVIIADEPTGNLDEKNTTQIMNIVKKLSKECLVILVTHERRLAEFYGDRIIEVVDGKVVQDYNPVGGTTLAKQDDQNIYLQEFEKKTSKDDHVSLNYFYDSVPKDIELNIIFKDGIFYLHSPKEQVKIKFLNSQDEMKVIDAKMPVWNLEDIDELEYHLPPISKKIRKNASVLKFSDTLKMAFSHLGNLRKFQKIIYFVMFLASILVTFGFVSLIRSFHVDEEKFLFFDRNLLVLENSGTDEHKKERIQSLNEEYVLTFVNEYNKGYSATLDRGILKRGNFSVGFSTSNFAPIEALKGKNVTLKRKEVVIDLYLAEIFLKSSDAKSHGYKYPEQLIGKTIQYPSNLRQQFNFKIVDIVDNNNPNIYFHKTDFHEIMMYEMITMEKNYSSKQQYIFDVEHILGNYYYIMDEEKNFIEKTIQSDSLKVDEVFIKNSPENRDKTEITIGTRIFKVAGFIQDADNINNVYVSSDVISPLFLEKLSQASSIGILAENKRQTMKELNSKKIEFEDLYDVEYQKQLLYNNSSDIFTFAIAVLVVSSILLFFLMRSSLISRIYQIGVYRSLGVKKLNIYRIFFSEVFILTTITSLCGIGITSLAIYQTNRVYPLVYYPIYIPILSFLLMILINTVIGLIPIFTLLRKTPSEILSKYDI